MVKNVLLVLQIITSVVLATLILLQSKGSGFSRGSSGGVSFTRRGLERLLYKATFVVAALFILLSLLQLLI